MSAASAAYMESVTGAAIWRSARTSGASDRLRPHEWRRAALERGARCSIREWRVDMEVHERFADRANASRRTPRVFLGWEGVRERSVFQASKDASTIGRCQVRCEACVTISCEPGMRSTVPVGSGCTNLISLLLLITNLVLRLVRTIGFVFPSRSALRSP